MPADLKRLSVRSPTCLPGRLETKRHLGPPVDICIHLMSSGPME